MRPDRRRLAVLALEIADGGDLHFEVGCRDVQLAILLFEQHVREDRQRVPPFDNARNGLQRSKQRVTRDLF